MIFSSKIFLSNLTVLLFLVIFCISISCDEEPKSSLAIAFKNWTRGTGIIIWTTYLMRYRFYLSSRFPHAYLSIPFQCWYSTKQAILFSCAPFIYHFFNVLCLKLPFFYTFSNGSFLPSRKFGLVDLTVLEGIYFIVTPQKDGFFQLLANNILAEFLPSFIRLPGSFLYAFVDIFLNYICLFSFQGKESFLAYIANIKSHILARIIRICLNLFILPNKGQLDSPQNSWILLFFFAYKSSLSVIYPIFFFRRYYISEVKEGYAPGEGLPSIFEDRHPSLKLLDVPSFPFDYVLPSISELASLSDLASLTPDDRIQRMADRMQARAESINEDLESILSSSATTVSSALPSLELNRASPFTLQFYGGTKGVSYFSLFTEKVILPELIDYFRFLQKEPPANEASVERFLRVLGKLRFYIAFKTASTNPQDFGFLMADFKTDNLPYMFDPIHAFPDWYKYFTKKVLGKEFAYPFQEPISELIQNPFYFLNSYCLRVFWYSQKIKARFLAKYVDFQQVHSHSTVTVTSKPLLHFISYSSTFAYFPIFTVFHAASVPSHFKELLPLLLVACRNPTLENVARLHYFINVRSFYRRGQAAISLWILTALFALDDKKLILDKETAQTGVNLDMFALMHLSFEGYLAFLQKHAALVPLS